MKRTRTFVILRHAQNEMNRSLKEIGKEEEIGLTKCEFTLTGIYNEHCVTRRGEENSVDLKLTEDEFKFIKELVISNLNESGYKVDNISSREILIQEK